MKKFIAIYETPCVGTTEEVIHADDATGADYIAWEHSHKPHYVPGGYDLYEIVYNRQYHQYEMVYITPDMLNYPDYEEEGETK